MGGRERERGKRERERKRRKKLLALLPEDGSLSVPIKSSSCLFSQNISEVWKVFDLQRLEVDKIEFLKDIFQNLIILYAVSVINIIHVH